MPVVRLPLVGIPNNRSGTTTKDQRFINCFPEEIEIPATEAQKFACLKRTGHVADTVVLNGSQTPRGIYQWNGATYSVYNNTVYKNTTEVLTLATNSGTVGFTGYSSNQSQLFLCDGLDGYIIYESGGYKKITASKWTATTVYTVGQRVSPVTHTGYTYEVTVAGTSGASQPTWPTVVDNTVVNGTVTFKCIEYVAFPTAEPTVTRTNSTAYVLGTIALDPAYPLVAFSVTTAGTTAAGAPTWNTNIGGTTTDGTVTWTTIAANTVITGHVPKPIAMDGYIFLLDSNGDLVNSKAEDPTAWPALGFVAPELLPDKARWLERQANHIAVFGDDSIEFFYNGGSADGSPLERTAQAAILVGCISPNTIVERDGLITFVANSSTGGSHVAMIEGLKIKPVTNETYNRVLEAEGSNILSAYAYTVRSQGHYFYVLNLTGQQRSLVFDITQKFWHEWKWDGGMMPFVYSTERNQDYLLQKTGSGTIYKMSSTAYADDGLPITAEMQTQVWDAGQNVFKFLRRATVIGDVQPTASTVTLQYTNDDYQTWCAPKTASISGYRPTWTRLGAFRRRAFLIKHTSSTAPFRAEALELDVTGGEE